MEPKQKRRFIFLVMGIFITSIWNVGGIASIMPFIRVLAAPESLENYSLAQRVMSVLNITDTNQLLLVAGILVLTLFITGNMLLAVVLWRTIHFTRTFSLSVISRLFNAYVWQPYSFYLHRHSAELTKNLFGEVTNVSGSVVKPMLDFLVEGLMSLVIIIFLIVIDPTIALIVAVLLGGTYSLIFLRFRRSLAKAARKRVKNNKIRYSMASESFGAIKELRVRGVEDRFESKLVQAVRRFEKSKAIVQLISNLPKYFLETIAFGGILAIAMVLFFTEKGGETILPLLSAYVFAGYRLMPSLQKAFSAFAKIRGSRASAELVYRELDLAESRISADETDEVVFEDRICIEDVTFRYPETEHPALEHIQFQIPRNTTVGIAGPTGCGKTTLIDVILGLLEPQEGAIYIDHTELNRGNVRQWQKHIGYVPQNIYLSDTTIRQNIAFGLEDDEIDEERVRFVSELANLDHFVQSLELGYETTLGERGVRISGGQRQRIGIARALYHDPEMVIFDEATSALDTHTEQAVMDAIARLMHQKTIIIIAHRLTTLKKCDNILVLKEGKVDATGTYDQLNDKHSLFSNAQ